MENKPFYIRVKQKKVIIACLEGRKLDPGKIRAFKFFFLGWLIFPDIVIAVIKTV
jgi:hypothetical protein